MPKQELPDNIPTTLEKLTVPIDGLQPYERNPRRGDISLIADSLRRHGQYRPIVVRAGTNEILAGNHTVAAAQQLGWTNIAATFIDVDDDTAARIVLIDNRSNQVAQFDDRILAELLAELPDLEGTGYDLDDLDALETFLNDHNNTGGVGDEGGNAPADEEDDQALADGEQAAWPTITIRVPPDLKARWGQVAGGDDLEKLTTLLDTYDGGESP